MQHDWTKFHRFQEHLGWCGPAVIQMALLSCGIDKTQEEIARAVYQDWWGTTGNIMLAYLSQFFGVLNFQNNSTLQDLSKHLSLGHIVIVNWWDDMDKEDEEGGHYSIIGGIEDGKIVLVDPSNARSGIWTIDETEFVKKWYDYLDVNNKIKSEGFLLWINPASKI